jgi:hypothetical protein
LSRNKLRHPKKKKKKKNHAIEDAINPKFVVRSFAHGGWFQSIQFRMLLRHISARKSEYMLIFFHKNSAHHPLPCSGDDLSEFSGYFRLLEFAGVDSETVARAEKLHLGELF